MTPIKHAWWALQAELKQAWWALQGKWWRLQRKLTIKRKRVTHTASTPPSTRVGSPHGGHSRGIPAGRGEARISRPDPEVSKQMHRDRSLHSTQTHGTAWTPRRSPEARFYPSGYGHGGTAPPPRCMKRAPGRGFEPPERPWEQKRGAPMDYGQH